jgi:hypothetical protein
MNGPLAIQHPARKAFFSTVKDRPSLAEILPQVAETDIPRSMEAAEK